MTREEVESGLKFVGFVIISCPLKPDTKSVVKEILNSTHHITMITGDNPLTACHVAAQLRLIEKKNAYVLSKRESTDLGNMGSESDEWCWKSIEDESLQKPVEFGAEQIGYIKPKKIEGLTKPGGLKPYNYLCLTGEVCRLFFFRQKG